MKMFGTAWRLSALVAGCLILTTGLASAFDDTTVSMSVGSSPAGEATRDAPILVMSFADEVPMHNMSLTSDGEFYYTINGGNAEFGQLNTYDMMGNLVSSVAIDIDARSILFSEYDLKFYVKSLQLDWFEVDPATGAFTQVFDDLFAFHQSSPAFLLHGNIILEHESGTMNWYESTGMLLQTTSGFYSGDFPSNEAVAADGTRIFTWDGTLVYVYDEVGNFMESWPVPNGHYGFSLSFANGLLWTCDDSAGGTGTWYGYDVGGTIATENRSWGGVKSLYR